MQKLQAFVNRCLQNILGIWWPEIIGCTTLQGKIFPRNATTRNATPRKISFKEFFFQGTPQQGMSFQGKFFPRNAIPRKIFLFKNITETISIHERNCFCDILENENLTS
jgi:hypothetical protein